MEYRIDHSDCLIGFDAAFRSFAVANGAPDLPDEWLGRSLWESTASSEINMVFRALLGRARQGIRVKVPSRCDSPSLIRFVEIAIEAEPSGVATFTSRLSRAQFRGEAIAESAEPAGMLRMCAWCFRVDGDGWQGVEQVAAERGLLMGGALPEVTHGICPECLNRRLGEIAPAR